MGYSKDEVRGLFEVIQKSQDETSLAAVQQAQALSEGATEEELQGKEKAVQFLRELRELLFLKKKNITRWEFVKEAALKANVEIDQLKKDYEGIASDNFADDLELARTLGVRGFPTIFFADQSGIQERVYGSKPYSVFENAILKLQPLARKKQYETKWERLFEKFSSLTSREFAELSGNNREEAELMLQDLYVAGKIEKLETKNGCMWSIN